MSCENCERLQAEHKEAVAELKKYLRLEKPETLIGGIRNLAQAYISFKSAYDELSKPPGSKIISRLSVTTVTQRRSKWRRWWK